MGASFTSVTSTPGDQTHIQKMLPQCARTAHSIYYGAFADL